MKRQRFLQYGLVAIRAFDDAHLIVESGRTKVGDDCIVVVPCW